MGQAFEQAADELYGLPLDEFVPRRDALARELRASGEQDDAAQVRRLAKPSAPAWAINQLARERPEQVRELVQAGEELRRVQDWLLRREADPMDLRTAVEAERAAVASLVHAGADLLTGAGRAPRGDVLERIGETLHAAAADPEVRADVESGRLVRDRAAVGLGAFGAAPAPAREQAREAAREAEAEAKASDRMRAAADRAVERAARALEAAESSWERARDELREARDELAEAQKAADTARAQADSAEAEADARRRDADGEAG